MPASRASEPESHPGPNGRSSRGASSSDLTFPRNLVERMSCLRGCPASGPVRIDFRCAVAATPKMYRDVRASRNEKTEYLNFEGAVDAGCKLTERKITLN